MIDFKEKSSLLFIYLIFFMIITLGKLIWELFALNSGGNLDNQIETAIWNLGIDTAVIITLVKHNVEFAKILVIMSTIICCLSIASSLLKTTYGNTFSVDSQSMLGAFMIGAGLGILSLCRYYLNDFFVGKKSERPHRIQKY